MKSIRILFIILTAMFLLNGSFILAQDRYLNSQPPKGTTPYPLTKENLSSIYKSLEADPGRYIWGPIAYDDIMKNIGKFDPNVYAIGGVPCRILLLEAYEFQDSSPYATQFLLNVENEQTNMENTGKPFSRLNNDVVLRGFVIEYYLPKYYQGMSDSIAKTLTGNQDGYMSRKWPRGKAYYLHNGCSSGQYDWAAVYAKANRHPVAIAAAIVPIINGDPNNLDLNQGGILYAWGYFRSFTFTEEWQCEK